MKTESTLPFRSQEILGKKYYSFLERGIPIHYDDIFTLENYFFNDLGGYSEISDFLLPFLTKRNINRFVQKKQSET